MPLFELIRLNKRASLIYTIKGLRNYVKTECTCLIQNNDGIVCGKSAKIEWLIEHQKIVHNVEYSSEFFELDHKSEDQISKLLECGECYPAGRERIQERKKFETLDDLLNHICPPKSYRKLFGARQGLSHCSVMGTHGETLFLIEKSPHRTQFEFSSATCWLGECYHSKLSFFTKVEDFIEHQKNEHNFEFSKNFMLKPDMETDNEVANVESTDPLTIDHTNGKEVNTEGTNQDCGECVEKTNKIQALEIANDEKKTKLETEIACRNAFEESNTKYRRLRQGWAIKVFQSDPSNEDLDNLLSLEPEKLFKKYEQVMKETNTGRIKLEETTETLQDVKIKLKLQTEQREIYEKQLSEVREVLHLPAENCNFGNILPAVKVLIEQNETNHYTNSVENLGN